MGTDSVLLADFALPVRGRICDLGCGAGAVMLLLALKGQGNAVFDGVELRPAAVEKARRNIVRAGLSDRMTVYQQDLRTLHETFARAGYTVVVANPPYMPIGGGIPPENDRDVRASRARRSAVRWKISVLPLRIFCSMEDGFALSIRRSASVSSCA